MVDTNTPTRSPLEAPTDSGADGSDQNHLAHPTPTLSEKQNEEQEDKYPPFATVVLIMLSLYMAMFLVALVGTPSAHAAIIETDLDVLGHHDNLNGHSSHQR